MTSFSLLTFRQLSICNHLGSEHEQVETSKGKYASHYQISQNISSSLLRINEEKTDKHLKILILKEFLIILLSG